MFEPDSVSLDIDSAPVDHVATAHWGLRRFSEAIGPWKRTRQTSEVSEDFGSLAGRELWPIA